MGGGEEGLCELTRLLKRKTNTKKENGGGEGNVQFNQVIRKPEDHLFCERSPLYGLGKAQNIQNLEKKQGKEMTLTFNTRLFSFTE